MSEPEPSDPQPTVPKSLKQLTADERKKWSLSHKLENLFLGFLLALAFDKEARWLFLGIVLSFGSIVVVSVYSFTVPTTKAFQEQMLRLKGTEAALADLTTFVKDQQSKLQESQRMIESLKEEHDQLKPIVETKKELVDAIFAAQSRRERTSMWINRGLGVLGTVLAAGIVSLLRRSYRVWKNSKRTLS